MLILDALKIARGTAANQGGITRTLKGGDVLVLKGTNGSGKTSFLRTLAGLLPAAQGTITAPAFHWVSSQSVPPSQETPQRYLAFHSALLGGIYNEYTPDPFRITAIVDTPFNKLSTGWRQRVKLTRLLLTNRTLWLLDEPSDGLDAEGITALQTLIAAHAAAGGIAVIATHQPQLWPHALVQEFGGAS